MCSLLSVRFSISIPRCILKSTFHVTGGKGIFVPRHFSVTAFRMFEFNDEMKWNWAAAEAVAVLAVKAV